MNVKERGGLSTVVGVMVLPSEIEKEEEDTVGDDRYVDRYNHSIDNDDEPMISFGAANNWMINDMERKTNLKK